MGRLNKGLIRPLDCLVKGKMSLAESLLVFMMFFPIFLRIAAILESENKKRAFWACLSSICVEAAHGDLQQSAPLSLVELCPDYLL